VTLRGFRRHQPPGYTMVAIVMFIAILTILIAAVGPSISTIMKREREEELLFRGKQYARAIALFQRRYGRYPTSLKEMYENRPRVIRKLWKDPMCNCDNWKLLIQGQPDSSPFMNQKVDPSNRPPSTYSNLLRPTPTPGAFGGPGEEQNIGPIVGVRTRAHQQAMREWRGRRYYDEWRFIVGDADSDAPVMSFNPGSLRVTPGGPRP
jgi:type II secretory pathway pseudopilin PulG